MNFLERVISNYALAWSQMFNYKGKTSRIPFWHFFILNNLIGNLLSILSSINLSQYTNDFYAIDKGYDWSYLYIVPSLFVFLALLIRRLRDIKCL